MAAVTRRNVKRERMPRKGRGAAAGHRERVANRQADALKLRCAGATFAQIGQQLGTSFVTAWRDVRTALDAVVEERNESAQQLRALELERLDRLQLRLTPKAERGDCEAARVLVRISERRSKLCGLDMPVTQRVDLGGPVVVDRPYADWSTEDLEDRLRRMLGWTPELAPEPKEPEPLSPAERYRRELIARGELPPAPPEGLLQ